MKMWEKGFYVRYGADTIQLAPAFTVEKTEIDDLVNALAEIKPVTTFQSLSKSIMSASRAIR